MSGKAKEKTGRERRNFDRTPVLWTGTMVCGDRTVDCVIMNASANGAKVRVSETFPFPSSVTLKIPRLGDFQADVVWTKENKLGVRFREKPAKVAKLMTEAMPQSKKTS